MPNLIDYLIFENTSRFNVVSIITNKGAVNGMRTCTKKELMDLGFKEYQAKRIIRQAKQELVEQGFDLYTGSKIGRVPAWMVEKIIGFKLSDENQ